MYMGNMPTADFDLLCSKIKDYPGYVIWESPTSFCRRCERLFCFKDFDDETNMIIPRIGFYMLCKCMTSLFFRL